MKLKSIAKLTALILVFILCTAFSAFAEEAELLSMTGGIEFIDIAMYDARGVTSAKLISNSEMSVEVLVRNTRTTSRNYCVFAAVYADDGSMYDVAFEKGRFSGTTPIDQVYGDDWIKKANLTFNVPEVTDKTVLKVMLFEAPEILSPEGDVYYMANKESIYKCIDGMKIDIENTEELCRFEGVVTSVPFNYYADYGYYSDETPMTELDGYVLYEENGREYKEYLHMTVDSSLVDTTAFLGKSIVAYIDAEEDPQTGNIMLRAIAEKQNRNKITKVTAEQLVTSDDRDWCIEGVIGYRNEGETKVRQLDLGYDVQLYVNYMREPISEMATTEELASYLYSGGTIEFISNDGDRMIDCIIMTAFDDEAVIEKVTEDDGYFMFDTFYGALDDIDTKDEDSLTVVYKDGTLAKVGDISVNDAVSIVSPDRRFNILYVSSKTVSGAVSAYDDEVVTIGGVDYKVGMQYGGNPSCLKDVEGIFFLNVNGVIIHNERDRSQDGDYAMVLAVDYKSGITDSYAIQVMLQDGTIAEYDLSSKVKYTDSLGNVADVPFEYNQDDVAASEIASNITGTVITPSSTGFTLKRLMAENAQRAVYRIALKNGEIIKISEPSENGYFLECKEGNTRRYDADTMTYGPMEFDENTVFFAIEHKKGADQVEIENILAGNVSSFITDGDEGLALISYTEKESVADFVIGFELGLARISENSEPIVITKAIDISYEGDDAVRIFGTQGGEEVTYIIYNASGAYESQPFDLVNGDTILISNPVNKVSANCRIIKKSEQQEENFVYTDFVRLIRIGESSCGIELKQGEYFELAPECVFNYMSGQCIINSDNIMQKIETMGNNISNAKVLYRITTVSGDYVSEITEIDVNKSLAPEEYTYSSAEYKINEMPLSSETEVFLMIHDDKEEIISLSKSSMEELVENGNCDISYYEENGVVKAVIGYIKDNSPLGMILAIAQENRISGGYAVQVMMHDGTVKECSLSDKVRYIDSFGNMITDTYEYDAIDLVAAEIASEITGMNVSPSSGDFALQRLNAENAERAVCKITERNGMITKIISGSFGTETKEYSSSYAGVYNAEAMTYGSMAFSENTVFFAIDSAKESYNITHKEVSVGKVTSFLKDGDRNLSLVACTQTGENTAMFAIGFELETSVREDSAAIVVSSVKNVSYNDDDAVLVQGVQNGEEVAYTIYNENGDYTTPPDYISKGDVILTSSASSEDIVKDCKMIFDISSKTWAAGNSENDIYNSVGLLGTNEYQATSSKFYIDADVKNEAGVWASATDGITMKSTANYTLVDYTESTKNPEISKKNCGTSLFNSRYPAYVFVRVYDDVLTEAVVYRYSEDAYLSPIGGAFDTSGQI